MVDIARNSSIADEEEARAARQRAKPVALGAALGVLLLIVILPALYRPTVYGKLPFDSQQLKVINAIQPDYVFIGNSMLGTRIDEDTLAAHLGKNCCYVFWTRGAETAWQHQALKNVVLAAEHRPKKVFVFFRDTYLTQVSYRATGKYWWQIERLSHEHEPVLDHAMNENRTWQESLEYKLGLLYPLQKRREYASSVIEWMAGQVVAPGHAFSAPPVAQQYNQLFDLDKLRNIEADDTAFTDMDSSVFDFDARIKNSLLPSMIEDAKQAGVALVFIRVQRRPTESGPPDQPAELKAYLSKLTNYLAANDAGYYDFTGDPELTLDRYQDGDHIRADWKPESTDLFLDRLRNYFQ